MDADYDQKFEEMKMYIPFLENMIQRLETTGPSSAHPRQAQLNKIKSLRDLLLDKKKRMKMENLLKCEQVLVNLYAKVEQRDNSLDCKKETQSAYTSSSHSQDLNIVRNKLKSVMTTLHGECPESLPEIARATKTEITCSPGSKEPALFQRRPYMTSPSPMRSQKNIESQAPSSSNRNYTRVLVSPDRVSGRWSSESAVEKNLYSRRSPKKSPWRSPRKSPRCSPRKSPRWSPKRSPRRFSPFHHKRVRKRSKKSLKVSEFKDLNITLKVPEESLHSLNTKDILYRIINCSDGDVDIDTLRELRTQILSELKQTGAKEDISDLILKSYNNRNKGLKKDFEEGELSDSDNEYIESIYSSLVIMDKDQSDTNATKTTGDSDQGRKIQICLVINADKDNSKPVKKLVEQSSSADCKTVPEFVTENLIENKQKSESTKLKVSQEVEEVMNELSSKQICEQKMEHVVPKQNSEQKLECVASKENCRENTENIRNPNDSEWLSESINQSEPLMDEMTKSITKNPSLNQDKGNIQTSQPTEHKTLPNQVSANIYKFQECEHKNVLVPNLEEKNVSEIKEKLIKQAEKEIKVNTVEIPLLNLEETAKQEVSEIDILQALKKEILSEKITINSSEVATTPLLHIPKVTKVASAQEIISKKRISIENYMQKSIPALNTSLFATETYSNISRDDISKKQSIKLTEKEYERFNLPAKLTLDDSSDDEDKNKRSPLDDTYIELAPKSPDHEDFADTGIKPPVIIPADPIKSITVSSKSDVDMRTLMPLLSPNVTNTPKLVKIPTSSPVINHERKVDISNKEIEQTVNVNDKRLPLTDPRVRRDFNLLISDSSVVGISECPPQSSVNFRPNMTPNRMPNSCLPNMTPNRMPNISPSMNVLTNMPSNLTLIPGVFEMTPSRQQFENEDYSNRNHVYAPIFPFYEANDSNDSSVHDARRSKWENTEKRSRDEREYQHVGYNDAPNIDNSLMYNRLDCPQTPIHAFGRSDVPSTPTHSFGRFDCPPTPTHTFGRIEAPMTPIHTFGRAEPPMTPVHPFGRSDCPPTPNHPFGRNSETLMTPNHPFARKDFSQNQPFSAQSYNRSQDPRINRSSEKDKIQKYDDVRENLRYKDRNSYHRPYSDSRRNYELRREQSIGRSDIKSPYEQSGRHYKEKNFRHESSRRRSVSRDYESDRSYCNDYGKGYKNYRYDNEKSNYYNNRDSQRNFRREHSIGRQCHNEKHFEKDWRAPSIGRKHQTESSQENIIDIKSQAGRSFSIDVSVNRTFQGKSDNIKDIQVSDSSFDSRRRRASSVGRTINHEPSVERGSIQLLKSNFIFECKTKPNFRRARSVGRDIEIHKLDRNFKDIKAALESYKQESDLKCLKISKISHNTKDSTTKVIEKKSNRDSRLSRKDYHELHSKTSVKTFKSYSPRNNNRDPRTHREIISPYEMDKRSHDYRLINSNEVKNNGIVYSNDNIAKGAILGSGYGVKNYKIPKIKKATEVIQSTKSCNEQLRSNKCTNKNDETREYIKKDDIISKDKEINYESQGNVKENLSQEIGLNQVQDTKDCAPNTMSEVSGSIVDDENISMQSIDVNQRRITRSYRKNADIKLDHAVNDSPLKKIKNRKRIVTSDSDSDGERVGTIKDTSVQKSNVNNDTTRNTDDVDKSSMQNIEITECSSNNLSQNNEESVLKGSMENEENVSTEVINNKLCNEENNINQTDVIILNTEKQINPDTNEMFDEDLEMFDDNVASSPVVDNINALIADLEDVLDTKSVNPENQFTKEITLENMLESISCTENVITTDIDHEKLNYKPPVKAPESSINVSLSKPENLKQLIGLRNNELGITSNEDNLDDKSLKLIPAETSICNSSNVPNSIPIEEKDDTIHSTTENEQSPKNLENMLPNQSLNQSEVSSSQDSTIEVNENVTNQEDLPDSTIRMQGDMNSSVTSIQESKNTTTPNSLQKELTQQSDSIESLLSILKDKGKIKELLLMLDNQSSENEKLKKKLEKLSEIVSDDEDSLNENSEHKTDETDTKENKLCNEEKDMQEIDIGIKKGEVNTNLDDICSMNEKCASDEIILKEDVCDQIDKRPEPVQNEEVDKNAGEGTSKSLLHSEDSSINHDGVGQKECSDLTGKTSSKSKKGTKKGKGKSPKNKSLDVKKCFTRSESPNISVEKPTAVKKPSRELKNLHDDIKEMFWTDNFLNTSGIRMCRLAKLVNDKLHNHKEDTQNNSSDPIVILEKIKASNEDSPIPEKTAKRKVTMKTKSKGLNKGNLNSDEPKIENNYEKELKTFVKNKPGSKSKDKVIEKSVESDPYIFESDSINDTNFSKSKVDSSECESDSFESSKSFGSTDLVLESKKKLKRKRRGWKVGIIKTKNKKKKGDDNRSENKILLTQKHIKIPDPNCYTDKMYCFVKNVTDYSCRLCVYSGNNIVYHYKKEHPHIEVPLSRMSPDVARDAINQSETINFQALSKLCTDRHVCRFCLKEFARKKNILEEFFWHVVSMHTGEYKQLCTECVNDTRCPLVMDVPPPPKEPYGQLIGYICGKCNFTQVSLENLKTHVINRHNDQETEVYTINLGVMKKTALLALEKLQTSSLEQPRILRSARFNQAEAASDNKSEIDSKAESIEVLVESDIQTTTTKKETMPVQMKESVNRKKMQSHITFENDTNDLINCDNAMEIKVEQEDHNISQADSDKFINTKSSAIVGKQSALTVNVEFSDAPNTCISDDIFDYPHFKVNYTDTGAKEYICCINGHEYHYKTSLLISLKKHVQLKHTEKWDGFCFLCKLIVTPQGQHNFKDCLQHLLEKHIDELPVIERRITADTAEKNSLTNSKKASVNVTAGNANSNTSYVSVRPLSELITAPEQSSVVLPVIESVVSLCSSTSSVSPSAPHISPTVEENYVYKEIKYEEAQTLVMAAKNNVVLEIMLKREKLIHIFKCAGHFCSYSTDNAEDALRHAVTHERVGGENSLDCAYCDYDSGKNAVELVTHVFKSHGGCQYVCSECFYRAAATQLVCAHAFRIHGKAFGQCTVLKTSAIARSETVDTILPRSTAVAFYMCNQKQDDQLPCKFRSYISDKFCKHLQHAHESDAAFNCSECSMSSKTPSDLILHLKTHGLKLYQCTWCKHGADTESEFMAHASAKHPSKQPQAYLRIITNKGAATSYKVLPLAHLGNSNVRTIELTPSSFRGNPEREAERSIDLEKLIGQTNQMIESMVNTSDSKGNEKSIKNDTTDVSTFEPEQFDQSQESLVLALQSSLLKQTQEISTPNVSVLSTPSFASPSTSLAQPAVEDDVHHRLTPVVQVKTELCVPEKAFDPNVIYCVDSDEENPSENTVKLSRDEQPSNEIASDPINVVKNAQLFKCGICKNILKNGIGYKVHIVAAHSDVINCLPCAYCTFTGDRDAMVKHYLDKHCLKNLSCDKNPSVYKCGICDLRFTTFFFIKKHLKESHEAYSFYAKKLHRYRSNGKCTEIVIDADLQKNARKRKSALNEDVTVEMRDVPVSKIKKYGPSDIDKLPIKPIIDDPVYCSLCEFNTKVRLNMVRHLQLHAQQQIVSQIAPVNPVPHLETNEKHFDKMVNLASSSIASRTLEKSNKGDQPPVVNLLIPPEAAARYPKYVPDKQRYTCGAKGCCYISVDEVMLKYHWETLHSGALNFHCVHCPPYQHLDTTKPLTASRIIAHLKMHDIQLYACSVCAYYHYKRQMVEKHVFDAHNGGHVMVVREECSSPVHTVNSSTTATPTMDLKPWQCGLCKFKSMLRPEVVEHCAKIHQSKMQYKCSYCAFRTSNLENIEKHQSKSHEDKPPEAFYFYYREGAIPNDPDDVPLWQKQRQKIGISDTAIKTEAEDSGPSTSATDVVKDDATRNAQINVDLNLVKKDPDAAPESTESLSDLCKAFGDLCDPNGLKYRCPLCKNVDEECKEAMQSHLYEELQYRKWGCGFCSYKAFHKNGLNEHMLQEHRQNRDPIALSTDSRVETWVNNLIEHQSQIIEKNKEKLFKHQITLTTSTPAPSTSSTPAPSTSSTPAPSTSSTPAPSTSKPPELPKATTESVNHNSTAVLEKLFGPLGTSDDMNFCCPKCNFKIKDENSMRDHLEMELNKIRWCCNACSEKFQNYHEAQFHCKSAHADRPARAVEATRDAKLRSSWISTVLRVQKLSMKDVSVTDVEDNSGVVPETSIMPENSFLVVRYEERVPTPEMHIARSRMSVESEDDEDKLVIDDEYSEEVSDDKQCPFCEYMWQDVKTFKEHVSKHTELKPYFCSFCDFNSHRKAVIKHLKDKHSENPVIMLTKSQRSFGPPLKVTRVTARSEEDASKVICLMCEKTFSEMEAKDHLHRSCKSKPHFAKKGDVVVKCCVCLTLHPDIDTMTSHHRYNHPTCNLHYAYYRLKYDTRSVHCCGHCTQRFKYWRDLKAHSKAVHSSLPIKYSIGNVSHMPVTGTVIDLDDDDTGTTKSNERVNEIKRSNEHDAGTKRGNEQDTGVKRSNEATDGPVAKRCARKSTTKLPAQSVAKKSTTKLPVTDSDDGAEYSFYGSKPQLDALDDVTTNMPFCNTVVPFTLKKLSSIIKINPTVLVRDVKK